MAESREEEYIRRMKERGYTPTLVGMDDDDIEWELNKMDGMDPFGGTRPVGQPLNPTYRPADPAMVARIYRQMGRPYDASLIPKEERYYLNGGWINGEDDVARNNGNKTPKRTANKRVKDGLGDASGQTEGRYSIFYSRDEQKFHLMDNYDGSLVKSWEGRSGFVPGFNEEGQPYESLPLGTYKVTAEVNKEGFPDKWGRPDPKYGTFYITTGDPRGRDAHGGGSGLQNPFAPRQGWADTQGCLRMQNEDGEELSGYIMKQGTAPLHVVKGPVIFGPFEPPEKGLQGKGEEEIVPKPMFPRFFPGPY